LKLTGGELIIEYLIKEEVPYILGIPGHGILGFFDALKKADESGRIKYIQVKHEQAAMHIADGYYRATGKPLAVFTSIGPGALNTAIGLGTSYVDSTAVILFTGDAHVNMKGVGVLQEVERYQDSNVIRALEPLCKRIWRIEDIKQLPRIMQRAFNQMLTGRPGPVAITLPMDIQSETLDVDIENICSRRTQSKPAGQKEYIADAVRLMKQAKRPVILMGGAAHRSGAQAEFIELAERWGAGVVTTMAGKSVFPENHPLYGWHTGSKGTPIGLHLCQKADVVLSFGARFADETTCSYKDGASFSFKKTKLIQVDIDPAEIGKNYPCEVGIIGDINVVAGQLLEELKQSAPELTAHASNDYTREIKRFQEQWLDYLEKNRSVEKDKATISQVIGELNAKIPAETIICTSSGNTQAQCFQEYCFKKQDTYLTTGGFSTMGFAMPAAIGAKLGKPDVPVIALLGDGDFMMIMQELSTMAQYDIPVVVVLVNNYGWMAIKDLQADALGIDRTFGNDWMKGGELYTPDFAAIAKAFGIYAKRITKREDVGPTVADAIQKGVPALIEIDVCREYPYSGGKAFGWWDVPIPGYLTERRENYEEKKKGETV
jgi:acetolactate synthase-1/2/3 large subunit